MSINNIFNKVKFPLMRRVYPTLIDNSIYECRDELNKKLMNKHWYKNQSWNIHGSVLHYHNNIIFNRNYAIKIYETSDDWTKLDKYLIESIQDILNKYNIKEIGIVGDLVDDPFNEEDVQTYYKDNKNRFWSEIPVLDLKLTTIHVKGQTRKIRIKSFK